MLGAQQNTTLIDAVSGLPVSNVAVFNSDKSITTISDFEGVIDLTPFGKNEKITLKHIGYQTIVASKHNILKKGRYLYLEITAEQLDEIVMSVSKWEQQRKDIPQKIATINAQTIAFQNQNDS